MAFEPQEILESMKFRFLLSFAALCLFAFSSGAAPITPGEKMAVDYMAAKSRALAAATRISSGASPNDAALKASAIELAKSSKEMRDLLSRGVANPDFNRQLIALLHATYQVADDKNGAGQEALIQTNFFIAAQNAQLIEQNSQIIALLGKIAAKK